MKLKTVSVDVKTLVTVSQFESYMLPPGKPLVIRGWMDKWPALSRWDFDFFKNKYGEDLLTISYATEENKGELEVKMGDYIDYIVNPDTSCALTQLEKKLNLVKPLYCISYKPFRAHPELWADFTVPPFVADWWGFFNESFTQSHFPQDQGWVLIGPRHAVAKMHQDSHHTLTWLAQIRGRKMCFLFAPDDSEAVYQGKVDPVHPQLDRYPLFLNATAYKCILNPGEMLFLPPNWWHHVIALDDCITLSCNFVNHINFGYFLRKAYGKRLPELLSMLPGRLPRRDPGAHEQDPTNRRNLTP